MTPHPTNPEQPDTQPARPEIPAGEEEQVAAAVEEGLTHDEKGDTEKEKGEVERGEDRKVFDEDWEDMSPREKIAAAPENREFMRRPTDQFGKPVFPASADAWMGQMNFSYREGNEHYQRGRA
jgi:hypothetical protein